MILNFPERNAKYQNIKHQRISIAKSITACFTLSKSQNNDEKIY